MYFIIRQKLDSDAMEANPELKKYHPVGTICMIVQIVLGFIGSLVALYRIKATTK
jgi:hypothetical protein